MEDKYFGKTKEEFIEFISDMAVEDKKLATEILLQHFDKEEEKELIKEIIKEWYIKDYIKYNNQMK